MEVLLALPPSLFPSYPIPPFSYRSLAHPPLILSPTPSVSQSLSQSSSLFHLSLASFFQVPYHFASKRTAAGRYQAAINPRFFSLPHKNPATPHSFQSPMFFSLSSLPFSLPPPSSFSLYFPSLLSFLLSFSLPSPLFPFFLSHQKKTQAPSVHDRLDLVSNFARPFFYIFSLFFHPRKYVYYLPFNLHHLTFSSSPSLPLYLFLFSSSSFRFLCPSLSSSPFRLLLYLLHLSLFPCPCLHVFILLFSKNITILFKDIPQN